MVAQRNVWISKSQQWESILRRVCHFLIDRKTRQEEDGFLKEIKGGFETKAKKEGDLSGMEARDGMYLREGVSKKNYSDNQQISQSKKDRLLYWNI